MDNSTSYKRPYSPRSANSFNTKKKKFVMHKTICSKCGKSCEVPFKPTGEKPIMCGNCFNISKGRSLEKRDTSSNRGRDTERYSIRPEKHKAVCSECGDNCELPFKPSGDKPVYCSTCFNKTKPQKRDNSGTGHRSGSYEEEVAKQFEIVNLKLDKIMELLHPAEMTKEEADSTLNNQNKSE